MMLRVYGRDEEPMVNLKRRLLAVLPVILLVSVTGFGIANALQSDAPAEDRGPQPGDFLDDEGNPDIAGYLVAGSLFQTAPAVATDDDITFRVFDCAEGSPITISIVPRLLPEDVAAANAALADDDPAKLAQEPVIVVEEDEALASGSEYEFTVPAEVPLGFARIRVLCTGPEGELEADTIINIVEPEEFEAEQADAEEPREIVTTVDAAEA
jgi:hypothetical protein